MHGRAVILSMLSLVSLGGCTQPNPLYYATATGSEPESDGPSSSEGGRAESESTDAT